VSEDNGIMQGMKEAGIFAMFKDVSIDRIIELASAEKRELIYILPDSQTCVNQEDYRTCALCVGKTIDYQSSFYEPLANKTRCARERE